MRHADHYTLTYGFNSLKLNSKLLQPFPILVGMEDSMKTFLLTSDLQESSKISFGVCNQGSIEVETLKCKAKKIRVCPFLIFPFFCLSSPLLSLSLSLPVFIPFSFLFFFFSLCISYPPPQAKRVWSLR